MCVCWRGGGGGGVGGGGGGGGAYEYSLLFRAWQYETFAPVIKRAVIYLSVQVCL